MGSVVDLDPGGPRRRRKPGRETSKTALVLGGGGLTGAVYEIGALRALDLLSVDRPVTSFDVYVGTSAGSFVAALLANGITPEQMMRAVLDPDSAPFSDIDAGMVLRPNLADFVRRGVALPWRAAGILRRLGTQLGSLSALDVALALADVLPTGLYSGSGIEEYVAELLSQDGRSDDFRALACELYLAATDLDRGERIVLGGPGWDDVPISSAVRASSALPMVYKPHVVRDRELVDGGIVSTTNLDLAVEAGAKLIVVVNPLVPYVNEAAGEPGARRVSAMGFPKIGYQTFKLLAYQRLHEMAGQWRERYPGVDIVLVEPDPDDELMFSTSVMSFPARVDIARHGFQTVTHKLAADLDELRLVCARHGIEISAARVRRVIEHVGAEPERRAAWRRILEQTTGTLLRQSGLRE